MKGSTWLKLMIMANVDFELNKNRGELTIIYSQADGTRVIKEKGILTGDEQTFIVNTQSIDSCDYLSTTEKKGLKQIVSRECVRRGCPEIIFPGEKL